MLTTLGDMLLDGMDATSYHVTKKINKYICTQRAEVRRPLHRCTAAIFRMEPIDSGERTAVPRNCPIAPQAPLLGACVLLSMRVGGSVTLFITWAAVVTFQQQPHCITFESSTLL